MILDEFGFLILLHIDPWFCSTLRRDTCEKPLASWPWPWKVCLFSYLPFSFLGAKAKQESRPVTSVAIKKGGGGHKLDKKKVGFSKREIQ